MSSDESEPEFIRSEVTTTRSGRKSKPLYKSSETIFDNKTEIKQNIIMASGIKLTEKEIKDMLKSTNTTILNNDDIPKFRGRRRENDPIYEEVNSIKQHINIVNNYINTLTDPTDKDKINVLLRSADPTIGDFHLTLNNFVHSSWFEGLTYDDLCKVLEDSYIEQSEKNIVAVSKELLETRLKNDSSVASKTIETYANLSKLADYIVDNSSMNVPATAPVKNDTETDEQFLKRKKQYAHSLIMNAYFLLYLAPQYNTNIVNSILNSPLRTTSTLVSDTTSLIRNNPAEKRVIIINPSKTNDTETLVVENVVEQVSKIQDQGSSQTNDYENFEPETEMYYADRGRNFNRNYRGRSMVGRYQGRNNRNMRPGARSMGKNIHADYICNSCGIRGHIKRNCRADNNVGRGRARNFQ